MTTATFIVGSIITIAYCDFMVYLGKKGWFRADYNYVRFVLKGVTAINVFFMIMFGHLSTFIDIYYVTFYFMVILPMRKHEFPVKEKEEEPFY